jgi:protein-L-isoaspartate(D-aspartate) O-methyltransferase
VSTTTPDISGRLEGLAHTLRERGALTDQQVYRAFATVQRHRCITRFHYFGRVVEVPQDTVPSREVLDIVYDTDPLLTIRPDSGRPASSSSAPTLMARMLEALELAPGMRVLEIGAGTGYNAALITTITGAEVVTVEAGEVAAAQATESIRRLDLLDRVSVHHRDGYLGALAREGRFDRIIVTCGISGIPPHWLDQLTQDGRILAPIQHGGVHPTMLIRPDGSVVPCLWSDFMTAAGPLRPDGLLHHEPGKDVTGPANRRLDFGAPLDTDAYQDAWFSLAALDARITRAYLDTQDFDPDLGLCALLADATRAAWLRKDGSILHTDAEIADVLQGLSSAWNDAEPPRLHSWRAELRPSKALQPLLIPAEWQH